ncbi:MAG: putative DNA-binding protein [Bacillota bacterium]|nr:putative DNA-binding protein [Bacillota bacterium]
MEERVQISILLDLYGDLLTDKQRSIMDLYFNDDLSLAEISEHTNTSRQAIFDLIKRCQKQLIEYENKLRLMEKNSQSESYKEIILNNIELLKAKVDNECLSFVEEIKRLVLEL